MLYNKYTCIYLYGHSTHNNYLLQVYLSVSTISDKDILTKVADKYSGLLMARRSRFLTISTSLIRYDVNATRAQPC